MTLRGPDLPIRPVPEVGAVGTVRARGVVAAAHGAAGSVDESVDESAGDAAQARVTLRVPPSTATV